jgi:hypothetical protein
MQSESVILYLISTVIQFLKVLQIIFGPICAKAHWSTNTVD